MVGGKAVNVLSWMSTRWVFHRQSSYSGVFAMPGGEHWAGEATSRVQLPVEVFAGLLQKRSAFSHAVIPDQLSSNEFRVISILSVRAGTRGSPPASLR